MPHESIFEDARERTDTASSGRESAGGVSAPPAGVGHSVVARRKVWLAELDALGRRMDDVEARIDEIVPRLLPGVE